MSTASHIHVRPLEIEDFAFVQHLASKQANFTIPPAYILWLMLKIKGSICIVAESNTNGPLAYLLAVPIEAPEDSIFVWQLAATDDPQRSKAMLDLLTQFRNMVFRRRCKSILFSTIPDSAVYRLIRQYAWALGSAVPKLLNPLPLAVSPNESEFRLFLNDMVRTSTTDVARKRPR